jgi:acyl carrier protein
MTKRVDGSSPVSEQALQEEVLAVLARAASEHLGLDVDVRTLDRSAPLASLRVEGLTLDSLDLLVLVLAAEEHFDCDIEEPILRTNPSWGQFVQIITAQVQLTRRGDGHVGA